MEREMDMNFNFFVQKQSIFNEWIEKNVNTFNNADEPLKCKSDVTEKVSHIHHCSEVASWELHSLKTVRNLILNGAHAKKLWVDEMYSNLETRCASFLWNCKVQLDKINAFDSTVGVPSLTKCIGAVFQSTTGSKSVTQEFFRTNFWRLHSITHKIFRKLDVSDLKSCRLVCKEWRVQSRRSFIEKVRCHIEPAKYADGSRLEEFQRDFSSPNLMPFSAVSIFGLVGKTTTTADGLNTLLSTWRCIKDVKFENITVTNNVGLFLSEFEISFERNNLTTLQISSRIEWTHSSEFTIRLKHLPSIRKLHVGTCKIIIDGRIAPTELEIGKEVTWIKDGNEISGTWELRRRDFLDVYRLKKLLLHNVDDDLGDLDADKYFALEIISFGGRIFTWNDLQIKQLYLSEEIVDLSLLPTSVEVVVLKNCTILPFIKPTNLAKLKTFKASNIIEQAGNVENLPDVLSKCPNLSCIDIDWSQLDLTKLPPSISKLTMFAKCKIVGSIPFTLEKLVINRIGVDSYSEWKRVNSLLKNFKALTIIIDSWSLITHVEEIKEILNIVKYQMEMGAKVAIGEIGFFMMVLDTGIFPFAHMVDRVSEYYLFKNGSGTGLTKEEFLNMKESISTFSFTL